jgi:aerobic C4-dicarboxylate transport protein
MRAALKNLYVQVLIAIALGVLLGWGNPELGQAMRPLGDGFIKLVKMVIAPVIFLTVVLGIAKMGDLKHVGRIGVKALIYFEVVTTLALAVGLVVSNLLQPGKGMNVPVDSLDAAAVASYKTAAHAQSVTEFVLKVIPDTLLGALTGGELLQVLFVALLFGLALTAMGERGHRVVHLFAELSEALFGVVAIIMRAAPIGAFGAMAFVVGKFGAQSLARLGYLMVAVYLTCLVFVFVVLGAIARLAGFSLWRFLVHIKDELMLVLGTSSSESALPRLLGKLEQAGCDKGVVGLVVPTGYSFNLDGTCIYLTMASLFVAQALGIPLTLGEQLTLLGVLLLTSKGAAGVTGSGFITLAATLSALNGKVPVEGVALILGVDRFMSEARAITNFIGNGVATMAIAKWEGLRDDARMHEALGTGSPPATAAEST